MNKTLLAALLAALTAAPVLAGNGQGKQGGRHEAREVRVEQKHRADERHVRIRDEREHVRSRDRDRDRLLRDDQGRRHAVRDAHRATGCPPGLAKKGNGCLPPGQAKKLALGQPLPPGAVYTLPRDVRHALPPAPAGYRYAVVNNQVVLVSRTDNIVVDILRGLLG